MWWAKRTFSSNCEKVAVFHLPLAFLDGFQEEYLLSPFESKSGLVAVLIIGSSATDISQSVGYFDVPSTGRRGLWVWKSGCCLWEFCRDILLNGRVQS